MHNPNTLHINTINADWCDKDIVLLHACFQLLTDCIEIENLNETTDWTQDDIIANAKLEIDELYNWWKERVKKEADGKLDPIWTEEQYEKDSEMLIRLIKVRKYLWT
jgi:hypothetical protein